MNNSASAMLGSTLPPHLSGASPTTYFYGNMVWQNIVESGKKIFEQKKNQQQSIVETPVEYLEPITILNDDVCGYNELHQVSFIEGADERMVVESVPFEKLNARDHNGNTPLMWAASQGNEQLVELLVDQGAAVNMQNFVGETALILAAARGLDKICTLLVENGGDSRLSTIDGTTPLHLATSGGHLGVIKTLMTHGAFVNSQDEEGDSPLHYAVREGKKEIVEFLVKNCGADSGLRNEDLETPLDLANDLEETAIAEFLSGCYSKVNPVELPEYHLYFGEENDMQVSKKEQEMPQVHGHGLFARSVASF